MTTEFQPWEDLRAFMESQWQRQGRRVASLAIVAKALPVDAAEIALDVAEDMARRIEAEQDIIAEVIWPSFGTSGPHAPVALITLKLLAYAYRGQPGWRQEWKP